MPALFAGCWGGGMSLPISNKALRELRKDTEYMLGLRGPAIDKEWWERVHSVVVELQERRDKESGK